VSLPSGTSLPPFEDVVSRHGPTVLRVCRAMLGYHQAEDAWSETFLSALRAYPELDPDTNLEAWLVTVAKRKAIDQHRMADRLPLPVAESPEPSRPPGTGRLQGTSPDPQGIPIDPIDPIGQNDQLCSALSTLSDLQRQAVTYHHVAGLPYAQVAVILGNSESAARRAAADGIKKLRTIYPGASSHPGASS
jgi:RNA polymerase sigma factor (sigma-70 family)